MAWLDADGQYDPLDLVLLLERLDATGSAIASGVRSHRADNWIRRALGRIGTVLSNMISGCELRDVDAGIKVIDTEQLDVTRSISDGGFISTELFRTVGPGRIVQAPVSHFPRGIGRQSGASPSTLIGLAVDFFRVLRSA